MPVPEPFSRPMNQNLGVLLLFPLQRTVSHLPPILAETCCLCEDILIPRIWVAAPPMLSWPIYASVTPRLSIFHLTQGGVQGSVHQTPGRYLLDEKKKE